MKKHLSCLIGMTILLATSASFASDLPGFETRLDKLSKSLRGIPASLSERTQLNAASEAGQGEQFLKQKINDYLKTAQFESKLKRNVDELFRVRIDKSLPPDQLLQTGQASKSIVPQDAYHSLVRKIISKNLSWDELLLHKEYNFLQKDGDMSFEVDDRSIYEVLSDVPEAIPSLEETLRTDSANYTGTVAERPFEFKFAENDSRLAGAITTGRFLSRYANTAINKNRRRAAAIFRIFLCDSMVAAIPSRSTETDRTDFDLVYPAPKERGTTEAELRSELKPADPHGAQADCRACHEKLDPVGRVFAFSPKGIHFRPSPGALSYRSKAGQKVYIKVTGVGDLAEKLTQQKDFRSCQVKQFWRWYVGQDVPISEKRESELVETFEKLGHRPKDFVAYLVQSSEFNRKPKALSEPEALARRATRIMKNCASCHTQSGVWEMADWDLTELPYGSTQKDRQKAIDTLKEMLDIENDGRKKLMPPKDSSWKLNSDDFQILKKWLTSGAPDYDGHPQVAPEVP